MMFFQRFSKLIDWYYSDGKVASTIRYTYQNRIAPHLRQKPQLSKRETVLGEIQEITQILNRYNCCWSLQTGNVLGLYRDNGFLENEDDVDLVVLAEDWKPQIEHEIRSRGYEIGYYAGQLAVGAEGVHICVVKYGWTFDIYLAFKGTWADTEYRWYGGTLKHRYYFTPELLERVRVVDLCGVNVNIPFDTDTYLRAVYGDTYMIPDSNWDWHTQPKCLLNLPATYLSEADIAPYYQ